MKRTISPVTGKLAGMFSLLPTIIFLRKEKEEGPDCLIMIILFWFIIGFHIRTIDGCQAGDDE